MNRRVVWYAALFVGLILAGVVLFLMFFGEVDPLLTSGLTFTTTATT
jgi:hypothetical protein